jgi:hypothetical protein
MHKYSGRIISYGNEDFLVMHKNNNNMFPNTHFFYIYKVEKEPSPLLRALGKTHKYTYIDSFSLSNFMIRQNENNIEYWFEKTVDAYRFNKETERAVENNITEFLNGGKES